MSEAALELSNVTKKFGDLTAIDDLSFTQARGSILGFLGPNGAGKTTSLRMILGLLAPDSGSLRVLGRPPGGAVRDRIGYLPEERGLYRRMRADRAIAYIATLKGVEPGAALARARALLEQYGLGASARSRIESLSKGMAQKVALLVALVHEPDLLILDEPFSGLDPINQQSFEETIGALARAGKTVVFSTHTMAQAERICDRLIILASGRKVFEGTLAEARNLLPRRVHIAADSDLSFLGNVAGVTAVRPPRAGQDQWEIDLEEGVDGRALLAGCFERRVALSHFDIADASLQDVFVSLLGNGSGKR